MFNKLRYKVATRLAKKAKGLIETEDFESIMKGLDFLKLSVSIIPPSKELSELSENLKTLANITNKV